MLNEVVQQEPATSLDPELMGSLAAIGIIKGKPFAPDDRMKKILTEALAVANATSRTLLMNPRAADWYYYPGSAWMNPLFVSGSEFETPIPMITREGVKPFPPTGYRTLDARSMFFYGVTGITPAMSMRLTGIGSQYLFASLDADKQYFDGAKTYKVTLPKGIPEEKFWSFTLYDNQTRSMLDTPQRYPRAGSQSYPSPAAEPDADGSTTVYFSPTQPAGVKRGNWIQTDPKKGWFMILRLYSPRTSATRRDNAFFRCLGLPRVYCGNLIPASRTTLAQYPVWEFINLPNLEAVPPAGSAPSFANAVCTLGFASARLKALLRCSVISGGVPLFTTKPTQSSTTSLGNPCSTMLGTSLNTAIRLGAVTASARSLPVAIRSTTGKVVMNMNWLVPFKRSAIACGNCGYGT